MTAHRPFGGFGGRPDTMPGRLHGWLDGRSVWVNRSRMASGAIWVAGWSVKTKGPSARSASVKVRRNPRGLRVHATIQLPKHETIALFSALSGGQPWSSRVAADGQPVGLSAAKPFYGVPKEAQSSTDDLPELLIEVSSLDCPHSGAVARLPFDALDPDRRDRQNTRTGPRNSGARWL
jgi:hypothetical protein